MTTATKTVVDEAKLSPKVLFRRKCCIYLKKLIPKCEFKKFKEQVLFTCPSCKHEQASAVFMGNTDTIFCQHCQFKGSIIETAYLLEAHTREWSPVQVAQYLTDTHGIRFPHLNIKLYLDCYEKASFDLVALIRNDKAPFEDNWINLVYKDRRIWDKWINNGYNIGVKTGKRSNITVVDIDTTETPEVFLKYKDSSLIQITNKGCHYVYQYEADIPTTRINELKIDLLNDGKQFVVYPSVVEGIGRNWNVNSPDKFMIPKMPEDVKEFLLKNIKHFNLTSKIEQTTQTILEEIKSEDLKNASLVAEGNRNNTLIKIGGILRKKLNPEQTGYVLQFFNKNFVKPILSDRELNAITQSLDKYIVSDEKDLAVKILDYLRYAEEGTSKDIEQALGEKKALIDKALSFLIKEQYIIKKNRMFHILKKVTWRDDYPSLDNEVDFKVPYFHDLAVFNRQDMVLIGGFSGTGKTTIAMNMVKRLIEQKIKPHYICLETGSRFIKSACTLGIKERDFFWSIQTEPTRIEIEKDSITILDWLLIENKAESDLILKYFAEQLIKTNSFLIIFMQLKEDNSWFAPNMITQFPAFATRYIYDKESNGLTGYFQIDKIRESRRHLKKATLPCRYFWETKLLKRIDEIEPETPLQKAGGTFYDEQ